MAILKISRWIINYGFGVAEFWGPFTTETVEQEFYRYANQCFGIRKSIAGFNVQLFDGGAGLPEYWRKVHPDAKVMLKHNGDVIVWGKDPETKLKSEFD